VGLIALFLAGAALAIGALSGGDEKKPTAAHSTKPKQQQGATTQEQQQQTEEQPQQTEEQPPAQQPSGGKPLKGVPAPSGENDPQKGSQLNSQGFQKLKSGDAAGAVPILENAVKAFPAGTSDVNYAYALYNLGDALVQAGRADEAIPILKARLKIPNQQGTVKAKLEEAKRAAKGK
jgi:tetratricopeptide (TPR) repeat protein